MATLIDGGHWTCTEGAAELLVERGLLYRCDKEHEEVLPFDRPIYHIKNRSSVWTWIFHHLQEAEYEVEYAEYEASREGPNDICTKCTHSRAQHRERSMTCAAIVGARREECMCYRPEFRRPRI